MKEVVNLAGFEGLARDLLEPAAYAYYAGGAWDEQTLRDNVEAFGRRRLRPRVLVDVSDIDTSTRMLGLPVSMPAGLAPNALQRLAHADAEMASARAAKAAGIVQIVSTISSCSLEEVAQAAPGGVRWFQLYVHKDRGLSKSLVDRAVEAGYQAMVLTVDLPVPGYRERELLNPLAAGAGTFGNFPDVTADELMKLLHHLQDQSLTWDDLEWVRGLCDLPLLLKGILTGEDAVLAVSHGVDGIVVSNHGGRQLDRAPASIDVLEEVVEAVGDRAEIYLDGGVRRGTDVLTALALGARGVFIGRPYLYALAVAGEEGVAHALGLLHAEIETAMRLLGTPNVGAVTRAHLM